MAATVTALKPLPLRFEDADFEVAGIDARFEGGEKHAEVQIHGCGALTLKSEFQCDSLLKVKAPKGKKLRIGYIQAVYQLERLGRYQDGHLSYQIDGLPMFDSSVNVDDPVFPFTKGSETVLVDGPCNGLVVKVHTRDRPRVGFPLALMEGHPNGKHQFLSNVEETIGLTTWLAVRDESASQRDPNAMIALATVHWKVSVTSKPNKDLNAVSLKDTKIDSEDPKVEYPQSFGEPVPVLKRVLAAKAQKLYWIPSGQNQAKTLFQRQVLPGEFYKDF